MKVLVLGATGFIGGAIARAAADKGWQVAAMRRDDSRTGAIGDLADRGLVEWCQADLGDVEAMAQAMRGCDVVFHAAAYYPRSSRGAAAQIETALNQTRNVISAFQKAKPDLLVYTSSLSTIGKPSRPGRLADEEDVYQQGSVPVCYFDVKIVMERHVLGAGIPVVVLCPSAVFGPGDVKPTSGILLINVARGRMPFWVEGNHNVVDVRDVAASHISAAETGRIGERYILGGENMTFRHMLNVTAHQSGRRPPWIKIPAGMVEMVGTMAGQLGILGGDILQAIRYWQHLDSSKARAELNHTSRLFTETVTDSLAWFRQNGYL